MLKYFQNISFALLVFAAAVTFALSFYVPIYSDDHAWPIVGSRGGYDGWEMISIWPLCKNMFGAAIPLTLWPGRFLTWLAYDHIDSAFAIRVFGMARFALLVVGLVWVMNRCFGGGWRHFLPVVVSLFFLGVAPLMMTLMRPEPSLCFALLLYALIPFYLERNAVSRAGYALLATLLLVASSWFFSAHPKAIFFFPLALYAGWSLKISWKWRMACLAVLLAIIGQSYAYWAHRTVCPDNSEFHKIFIDTALQPALLFSRPLEFIQQFLAGVTGSTVYLDSMLFAPRYGSGWLPPIAMYAAHGVVNTLIRVLAVIVVAFWVATTFKIFRRAWIDKSFLQPACAVPMLLLGCLVLTAGFQQIKSFYDVLIIWILGVGLTLILLQQTLPVIPARLRGWMLVSMCLLSFASQLLLLKTFWNLPEVNRRADVNGALQHQPLSASMLRYDEIKINITTFAQQCDIDASTYNSHLLVDMFTYLPYKASYQPVFVKHLDDQMIPYAYSHQSSGIIALCASLPAHVQALAIKNNGLCCVSHSAIQLNGAR